ncbi:hypothetical protein DPMN_180100 [Dreissena polymorpha]|uniref:Uncharacterized protein n=1 Tax=Dreissena polymorpha TaxID=45954 RepID=A0A9D4EHH2_DREPO|nr:hypothetical protein DPMN_180100 [Dreissena polymorpha]
MKSLGLDGLSIQVENASADMWQTLHGLNIKSLNLCIRREVKHTKSLSQALSSLTQLEILSIELKYCSPSLWDSLHGLNIKSLSLRMSMLVVKHKESLSQSLLSLTKMETLSIRVKEDSPDLWEALHGLSIKSLSLSIGWKRNLTESLSQSLLSLTQMDTLSISVRKDSPGLWGALHGLSIKSLSLSLKGENYAFFELRYATNMKQSLLSLTKLETLSISVDEYSPGMFEALYGLKIKGLSLNHENINFKREHKEPLSQSLSSLSQLETLTLHLYTYIALQLPQSLKYFNIYCAALRPSKLRDLCDLLTAFNHTIEMSLEFGCASSFMPLERISLQEYIPFHQEFTARKNVAVKRFRINESHDFAEFTISVRDIDGVDDAAPDDYCIKDYAYQTFVKCLIDRTIDRISIRLQIDPD